MPELLPAPLVARARRARRILEVGTGARFETARALAAAAPQAAVWVSDVDPRVLAAPPPLKPMILDVLRPDLEVLVDVDLVVAVRVPEELQAGVAELARVLGADLAMRPLKDEWADVSHVRPKHDVWSDGWRCYQA